MVIFFNQISREFKIASRSRSEIVNPLIFLFLGATLFGLAGAGDREQLSYFASGILWVLVLLSNMLSLEFMYRRDYLDGSLEQLVLLPETPFIPILAKIVVQWLLSGCVMTLIAPAAGLLLFIPSNEWPVLMLTLVLGSPALSFFGAICAALTVGAHRAGILLGLLALPLYIPILIFGISAITSHTQGMPIASQLYSLTAITVLSLTLAPHAVYGALKLSVDE